MQSGLYSSRMFWNLRAALPFVLQHQRLLEDTLQSIVASQPASGVPEVDIRPERSIDSRGTDFTRYGAKSVPIPESLRNEFEKAIEQSGDTQEKACGEMHNLALKTLRKLRAGEGRFHEDTLRN